MPVIEMKANIPVLKEQKKAIAAGFVQAFVQAGEEMVSKNLLIEIDGDRWIDFRGDSKQPSALVTIHPGPMTPEEDYASIVGGFFATLQEVLPQISADRIYMTISEIRHWGWAGRKL